MEELTKDQKRCLRDLASLAHERELGAILEELEADFLEWRSGEISAFELNQSIHAFHKGPARKIWGFYDTIDATGAVARALAHGFLEETEVDGPLRASLARQIEYFREQAG